MGDTDKNVKKIKNLIIAVYAQIAVFLVAIISFAFYLGTLDHSVKTLEAECFKINSEIVGIKANMVNSDDYSLKNYYYRTNYLWAERWGWELPEQPFNIRGLGVPNL